MMNSVRDACRNGRIVWQKHALQRMMEREISRQEVKRSILEGEVIEEYPDDKPFPSLLVAHIEEMSLHVVISYDRTASQIYVITVYRPDLRYFENDLKTRRRK
ncbi:DUF4258 domain-containing protein [Hydrogenimonas sp.]